jgi:hypothetical protein
VSPAVLVAFPLETHNFIGSNLVVSKNINMNEQEITLTMIRDYRSNFRRAKDALLARENRRLLQGLILGAFIVLLMMVGNLAVGALINTTLQTGN